MQRDLCKFFAISVDHPHVRVFIVNDSSRQKRQQCRFMRTHAHTDIIKHKVEVYSNHHGVSNCVGSAMLASQIMHALRLHK